MSSTNTRPPVRKARTPESFESLGRRNAAAEILQSYERLSWYSFERGESLVQTRMHFRNIVAGLTEEDEKKNVLWHEDFTPHAVKPGDQPRSGRKGKDRVSFGGGHEGSKTPRGDVPNSHGRDKTGAESANEAGPSQRRSKRKSGASGE